MLKNCPGLKIECLHNVQLICTNFGCFYLHNVHITDYIFFIFDTTIARYNKNSSQINVQIQEQTVSLLFLKVDTAFVYNTQITQCTVQL